MERPMRFAAPVTSTTLPFIAIYSYYSKWRLGDQFVILARGYRVLGRFGKFATPVAPPPEESRRRTDHAGDRADGPRAVMYGCGAGQHHRYHHHRPRQRLESGEDAAAILILHVVQQLRVVQDRTDRNC